MTHRAFSLERQLLLRLSAIFLGSFLLFGVVYLFLIKNDAQFHALEEVGERAASIGQHIHRTADGGFTFNAATRRMMARQTRGAGIAAIALPSNRLVAGSSAGLLPALLNSPADAVLNSRISLVEDGLTVRTVQTVHHDGQAFRIILQMPMSREQIEILGLTDEFTQEIIPCFLPALTLAILVTWLTLRRRLRPLRRASAEAARVSVDAPGQRVGTDEIASEVLPLIHAVNQALARLEADVAAQRRFAANAAHELRTPLAVLRARVEGLPPGEARQFLERDIDRMSRAVAQMLLTARVQSRQVGEMAPLALVPLVREVLADLVPLADQTRRQLMLEVISQPVVRGNEAALNSAVRNLVENALRFTPPGDCVRVQVGPGATITVEDHGPGVSDEDKARIFQPFWRAEAPHAGGAGLGLAIVSGVMALHDGRVTVEDVPGGGARFVLSLTLTADTRPMPRPVPA